MGTTIEVVRGTLMLTVRGGLMWLARRFGVSEASVYRGELEFRVLRAPAASMSKGPIDAYWLTGLGVLRELERGSHGIARLILPHPTDPAVRRIQDTSEQPYDLQRDIVHATEQAQNLSIEVRWYSGFLGMALTIGPGWLVIEPILPHGKANKRPIVRIDGWGNGEVVSRYRAIFDKLWLEALPPDFDSLTKQLPPSPSGGDRESFYRLQEIMEYGVLALDTGADFLGDDLIPRVEARLGGSDLVVDLVAGAVELSNNCHDRSTAWVGIPDDPVPEEVENVFYDTWEDYQRLRIRVSQCQDALGLDTNALIDGFPSYFDWAFADSMFADSLGGALVTSRFASLRARIETFADQHELPHFSALRTLKP